MNYNDDRSFQTGDVVSLKSGGPKMTIEFIAPNRITTPPVKCVWFIYNTGTLNYGYFTLESLKLS